MVFSVDNIIDPFTRADSSSLGANWTQILFGTGPGPRIISNAVGPSATGGGDFSVMYWNPATFGIQTESFITISTKYTVDDYDSMSVGLVYVPSPMDGYLVQAGINAAGDLLGVYRYDDGIGTLLGATVAQEITNGDAIGIRRVGNDIQLWHRTSGVWKLKATRTDSTYPGPYYPALYTSDTNAGSTYRYDDFGARLLPVVYDSFDRADENPIASPWLVPTAFVAMQIVSNMARCTTVGGGGNGSAYTTIVTDDHACTIVVNTLNAGGQARACVRMLTSELTMYMAVVAGPFGGTVSTSLAKYVNSEFTTIASGSTVSLAAGGIVTCKCQGSIIKMLVNDVEIYSVADYSIPRGMSGVGAFCTTLVTEVEIASWETEYATDGMSGKAGGAGGFGTDHPKFLLRTPPLTQGRGL